MDSSSTNPIGAPTQATRRGGGNTVLAAAALAEAVTGMALMVAPSTVARLLLGAGLSGVGIAMGRVAGIA